jgi:membrane protein YdbS with pleckstrin-like domain
MLREFNMATVTAHTKHAATNAAAVPASKSDDAQVLLYAIRSGAQSPSPAPSDSDECTSWILA